jgi:hypothetical protein
MSEIWQCTKIIRGIFINYIIKKLEFPSFFRLTDSNSQPVFIYKLSVFVKIGRPVTILGASSWSFSSFQSYSYPIVHMHIQKAV